MFLVISISLIALFVFHELYWKRRNFPPGPVPLPFFGNLLALNDDKPGYKVFDEWKKKYGSVFTFWIGSEPFIMITSYEKLKETFVKDGETYTDKPLNYIQDKLRGGQYGVLDTNGEVWRDQRRFALTELRNLGLGKDLMQEKKRAVEFACLKDLIDSQRLLISSTANMLQLNIPFLENLLPKSYRLSEQLLKKREEMDVFFMAQIEEHRKCIDFDETENSDFVEAYLKEQRKRTIDGDSESFNDKQLVSMCFDLWLAGLITTTITLTWAISYYLHNPIVQKRIHEELDTVVGASRLITTADRSSLNYLNAFINEAQRCVNLLAINLKHMTTRDTVIDGFPVKKGTGVIAQISTVMTDDKVFPDPYLFNPDRFLESNGKLKKVDELLPFSIGKRQCLGEGMARMELFLFLANLFNQFKIEPSKVEGLPMIDKSKDNIVLPRDFRAILRKRFVQ